MSLSGILQSDSLTISEKFFGRRREFEFLTEAMLGPLGSGTPLMIVRGPAGIGKTTLIKQVLASSDKPKDFILYGKFENRENSPYSAFRQAFTAWSQEIFFLEDDEYDLLKENLTSALQTNINAITGVFKELEVFFSRKNLLYDHQVQTHQMKARLYFFLKKFFRSFSKMGYRVIIFLDDLQWADNASLYLLEELVKSNDVPGLTLVAAARSSKKHSQKWKELYSSSNVSLIYLKPLSRESIGYAIPGEWNLSKQNTRQFRNYLWLESGGNPFKVGEILKLIQRENPSINTEDPEFWKNLPRLGSANNSQNFVRKQLRKLPFQQGRTISAASCLGYAFEPESLDKILDLPGKQVGDHLSSLVKMQLLHKRKNTYIFNHDTVFSAANSLLSEIEKSDLHQKLAIFFQGKISDPEDDRIFQAVNHLNQASEMGAARNLWNEQLLWNIQAGKLAVKNTAFEAAHGYFATAERIIIEVPPRFQVRNRVLTEIFGKEDIETHRILFSIRFGIAETAFLLQKFEKALDYVQQILEGECSRHQRLKTTLLKLMICSSLTYHKNNTEVVLDGVASLEKILSHYGIDIPKDREQIRKESVEDCRKLIKEASDLSLGMDFSKKINPDEEYHDLMNLITTSMTLLYFVDPYKNLYMVSKTLLLTLKEGFAPLSPVIFAASFFTGFFSQENKELAHFLGQLSLKMIEGEPFKNYSYMVYYIAVLNFFPWDNHYKRCVQKLEEGAVKAMESGDRHYASFCHTITRITNTFRGKNLLEHSRECAAVEQEHHVYFISGTDRAISDYLTGEKEGFLRGDFVFPEEIVADSEFNLICRYNYLLAKEKLNYFARRFDVAQSIGEEINAMVYVGEGYQIELEHFFFYSLSLLQSAFLNPGNLSEILSKVAPKLKEFKRLSVFKSGNYQHKIYLIEAETAKCKGDFENATLHYDLAIDDALKNEFVHHAAIAAERAFDYFKSKDRKTLAEAYLAKSLQFYGEWGALEKVKQLQKENPDFLHEEKVSPREPFPRTDFSAIQEILGKTALVNRTPVKELGQDLSRILWKEGKAKRSVFLLLHDNVWNVLATHPGNPRLIGTALGHLKNELPVSLLNFTIKRGSSIILVDPVQDALFSSDPFLKKERITNVTVLPVKQSERTVGIIYLENCQPYSETEKDLFLLITELASTTFANAIYYEDNETLNKVLKLQESNRIEAVIESQEKERQRIARELHDSLGQILALSKINLSRINIKTMDSESLGLLNNVSNLIDESCQEVRTISYNLMPPDLVNKSLIELMENLIDKNRLTSEVCYEFNCHLSSDRFSYACKFTLYRVLQEILQNIIKHAAADRVVVSISQTGDFINLMVEDNGKGFDPNFIDLGLGLKNIQARIKLLNGYFDIDSSMNQGTAFNISIPIKPH